MPRVLILCTDPVGPRMSGPAIRAVETARVLARRFEVTLAAPGPGPAPPGVLRRPLGPLSILDDVRRAGVVITQGVKLSVTWPLLLLFPDRPCVWDLSSPVTLENLGRSGPVPTRAVAFQHDLFRLGLERGDFFICGGERQRELYEGALAALGRRAENGARLCEAAPHGIPPAPPEERGRPLRSALGLGDDAFVLLWPGGLWDWTDPLTPIRAVARRAQGPGAELHLVFLGTDSPAPHEGRPARAAEALSLACELGLLGRRIHFISGWTDYADRGALLLDADAGISAHPATSESRFAYRGRLMDVIWAGRPVICTEGDEVGDRVAAEGLGRALPPGDVAAWERAIGEAAAGAAWFREAPARMEALRASITWERQLAPLAAYVASPRSTSGGWSRWPRYAGALWDLLRLRIDRHWRRWGGRWPSPGPGMDGRAPTV